MKTRSWILLLLAVALVLGGVLLLQSRQPARRWAEVLVDGVVVQRLDLSRPQQLRVDCAGGYNVLQVENGKIRVLEADCPGQDCVHSAARAAGAPIVCLPHRLIIRFTDYGGLDAKTG